MRAPAGSIRLLIAVIAVLLCARVPDARAQAAPAHRPGEVLVKYRATASPSVVATLSDQLGSDVIESFPKLGIERLRVRDISVEDAVARLRSDPAVEFAEPNYIYQASVVPNDPGFPQLWGLLNTGQTGGTPGADIHAAQAWNTFTGSAAVLVGVIDTGVDYTHPDLAANMFVNLGEIPGNGIDDDQNGFVDDVRGWDFANNDSDPMDDHYHGTHVSGTIGAVGNNGIGVVGVTWSARILPIKFLDAGGSGSTEAAIRAIDYATVMGVRVINASWGGGGYSEALRLAIEAAGNAGVLFVAAAGNSGVNTDLSPNYPSAYDLDNIVAVAATDANDQLAYFSNYGPLSVDLGAPGVDTYSTVLAHQYGTASGTSMATPHVVGVAALIRGRFPAATVAMTKALLLNRAEPRTGLAGRVLTGARLDALHAIADPDTIPPAAVTDLVAFAPGGSRMSLHWTASGDDGRDGTAFSYDVRYSTVPITEQNFAAATPAAGEPVPGPAGSEQQMIVTGLAFSTGYHFALRVLDEFGNASEVGNDASATTLGPPDIAIAPDSLSADLLTGATATRTLTLTNSGVSDLVLGLVTDGLPTWIAAAPESANVGAGSQLAIEVTFDAGGMNDGDYDGHLVFGSNDPDEPAVPIALHLHVTGAPDIAVAPDSIDFGPLFLGATRTDSVVVSNPGTAPLGISSVAATPATFSVDPAPFSLAPGGHRTLAVTFSPVAAEPALGTLTITSDDPDRPVASVALSGLGLVAPDIAVAPELLSADLFTGETATRTLTIENTGGSDLTFLVSTVEQAGAASIRIGIVPPEPDPGAAPSSRSDRAPEGYRFAAAPHEATAGARVLLVQDYLPWGSPANHQILAANGIAYDAIASSQLASTDLSAYAVVLVASDQPTSTYVTLAGRAAQIESFVLGGGRLEFHAAGWGWNGGDASLVTLPGGMRIARQYSGLNHVVLPAHPIVAGVPNPFTGNGASHAHFTGIPAGAELIVRDDTGQPNLVVYRHGAGRVIAAGQTLEYGHMTREPAGLVLANLIPWVVGGSRVPWLRAEPLEGRIPAAGSVQITVTFDATGLLGGDYRGAVRLESNDPDESLVDVPALLRVTGVPRIAVGGRLHDIASVADYVSAGAVTQHTLALPSVPALDGSIRLLTDGDFSAPGETATLIVEGTMLGQAGQRGVDCTPDSADFALTESQLQQWGADRRVQVTVANAPTVDPFCLVNRHTVHFRYRDPADQLAFGLRLLGTCRSETLEVSNPGTDSLVVSSIASSSPAFVVGTSELRLGPGASALVGVTFCPAAAGAAAATLTFSSNDPVTGTVAVAMTGGGAVPPDIAVTPAALDVELAPNDSLVRTLTISNTGGPLLWSTAVTEPRPTIVVESSPVHASLPEDAVPKDSPRTPLPSKTARFHASASASPPTGVEADPLPGGVGSSAALEDILASLDAHHGDVTAAIPNRFDFFEGVTGFGIDDGGNDMYDGGNYLSTNLGGLIEYSDGVIRSHPMLGANGRYFTRKYPGLFVFVADLDGVNAFNIDGNLGADGGGSVDGAVIDVALGDGYRAFVKRVFNTFDPSVNHLLIVPDGALATHAFALNTNDDHHSVNGLSGTRIYYLLYAGANGGYIDNAAATNLLTTFISAGNLSGGTLAVSPATGGVPDGGSVTLEVTFHSRELDGGEYDGQVVVTSNDPDEDPVVIPTRMRVLGIPDIAVLPDAIDFGSLFVGGSRTRTLIVRNAGTSLLTVSGVLTQPGIFTTDPAGFALAPHTQDTLVVSFAPTAVGPLTGTLTLSSDDPDEPQLDVPLLGTGLVPPDIAVSPDSLQAEVEIDRQTTRTLTIANTGGSDLTFEISMVAEDPAARIPVAAARLDAGAGAGAADSPRSDQAPADYRPRTPAYGTTAGARVLLVQDVLPWGSTANHQILAANGIAYDAITSTQLASTDLSAYAVVLVAGDQPTFTYVTLAGRAAQIENFVLGGGSLEFHAAGWGWNGGEASLVTLPGGMHIQLYGSTFNYLLLPAHPIVAGVPNPFTGSGASHAHFTAIPAGAELIVRDEAGQPNLVVYRHGAGRVVAAGQTLEYGYRSNQHAGLVLANLIPWVVGGSGVAWLRAEPLAGTIPAGDSRQITVTFDATGLLGGDHEGALRIESNDPDEVTTTVPARLRVIGVPDVALTPPAIDFGPTFVGGTRTGTVVVRNTGTGVLNVSAVTATPGAFAPDSAAFALAPGAERNLRVSFTPAAPGPVSGTLVVASDDPDEPLASVALAGLGTLPPDIEVAPSSLSAELPAGGQATRTLLVSNTGGSDLAFRLFIGSAMPPDSLRATPPDAVQAGGSMSGRSDHRPTDYRPAAARASTAAGAIALLIQDVLPWGSEANGFLLDLNGIAYDAIPSYQLAATNLADYRVVIVAGDQPSSTYLTLSSRAAQLEDFVLHGGALEFHAAGGGFAGGDPTVVTLPGGMRIVNSFSGVNHLLLPGHPVVAGVPNPFTGNLASHAAFTSIPAGAVHIVRDEHGRTNLVSYPHGIGRVVAAGQALERGFSLGESAGLVLRNLIPYVAHGGIDWLSVQPLAGTVPPGSSVQLTVTFDAAALTAGDHEAIIEVVSDDPDEPAVQIPALLSVLGAAAAAVDAEAGEARFDLAPVRPTPARGMALIEFELSRAGDARATIFDVAGRRIRVLAQGRHEAGRHRIVWSGEGEDGATQGAGVYLLRLETGEGKRTRRMIWVP